MQEESSDEEDGPRWVRSYDERSAMLKKNENARTRFVEGMDDEEFVLQPAEQYEPLIAPRRIDSESEAAITTAPPTSDHEMSEAESESKTSRGSMRRSARKRNHEDESEDTSEADTASRVGKRRRSVVPEETTETPTRSIATRRQRQREDERKDGSEGVPESLAEPEDASAGPDTPTASGTKRTRATSARRSANQTPDMRSRVASTKAAAHASPSPASRTRPRR